MSYVDGFVLPIPKKKAADYKKVATAAGKIWLELGALGYVECMADDVAPGKLTSFPQAVMLKKDEVVFFSWITFKSRKDRDRVNKLVMEHPKMKKLMPTLATYDIKRMIHGGFKPMVDLTA